MLFRRNAGNLAFLWWLAASALGIACTGGLKALESGAAPALTNISPEWMSISGGETLTIEGNDFVSGASVYVGSNACQTVNVVSRTEITCRTPAGASFQSVDVRVVNPDGQAATALNAVSYSAAIGQTDLENKVMRGLHRGMSSPSDVSFYDDASVRYMIVTDTENHRVLVWKTTSPEMPTGAPSFVIGQPNPELTAVDEEFASRKENYFGVGHLSSLKSPSAAHFDGTHLFIVDSGNNRVLVWEGMPEPRNDENLTNDGLNPEAKFVLGQTLTAEPLVSTVEADVTSSKLNNPTKLLLDGGKLYVSDTGNNRILGWDWDGDPAPSSSMAAIVVFGQEDFVSGTANSVSNCTVDGASPVNGCGMKSPTNLLVINGKFYVSDTGNHRVLVWNAIPTDAITPADVVLGQADATSGSSPPAPLRNNLFSPMGLATDDGTHLFVADTAHHRVIKYSISGLSNGMDADLQENSTAAYVIGQIDYETADVNRGSTTTALGLDTPVGVVVFDLKFFIVDQGNNRILNWQQVPTSSATAAAAVYGQSVLTTNTSRGGGTFVGRRSLSEPAGVGLSGSRIFVADEMNNRVLIWDTNPMENAALADKHIGQTSGDTSSFNNHPGSAQCGAAGLNGCTFKAPAAVFSDGVKMVVADKLNHRVLIYNEIPEDSNVKANIALGQDDFASRLNNTVAANTLNQPEGVIISGNKLIVADTGNNRVLIWNSIPISRVAADVVLGQSLASDSEADTANNRMNRPTKVAVDQNGRLYVSDTGNHRILIWNSIPESNSPADIVLGQEDFNLGSANKGGSPSASSLSSPIGLSIVGTRLYVADSGNNRILVWKTLPTSTKKSADLVFGQVGFAVNNPNNGGYGPSSLSGPYDVAADSTKMVISDTLNNRVLIVPIPQ